MSGVGGPTAIYAVLSDLLTQITNELDGSIGGKPSRVLVVAGEIAWDECTTACGSLLASIDGCYLTDQFPHSNVARNQFETANCRTGWFIVDGTVSLQRCAPVPQGNDVMPSNAALTASAKVVMSDAWILLDKVACVLEAFKVAGTIIDYTVGDTTMHGPEGGCVGVDQIISVAFDRGV